MYYVNYYSGSRKNLTKESITFHIKVEPKHKTGFGWLNFKNPQINKLTFIGCVCFT